MSETVTIDREALEQLLWFAKKGDVAVSQRRLRNGFRQVSVCSSDHREGECLSCQAFTAAEAALASPV